jgi:hypothetical protein
MARSLPSRPTSPYPTQQLYSAQRPYPTQAPYSTQPPLGFPPQSPPPGAQAPPSAQPLPPPQPMNPPPMTMPGQVPPPGQPPPHWNRFGQPGYPGQFPVKKSGTGPILAVSLAAVMLVGLVVAVAVGFSGSSHDRVADAGYSDYPTTSETSSETTESSSRTSSATSSSRSTPASSDSSGDNTPSGPRQVIALADHPLLTSPNAGLQNAPCDLPGWPSDPSASEAFFTAAEQCLDAQWSKLLGALNLPWHSPKLHFPTGATFQTDCGTFNTANYAAYYCRDNLYVPFQGLQTSLYKNQPGIYLAVFAHEYGHHVQDLTGLMTAAWNAIYDAGQNSPAGLEMSRRKELQAQCFSGVYLGSTTNHGGSVTQRVFDAAWNDQETRGDNTSGTHDHGTNAHYASWWRQGARSDRVAQCNTFAASSGDVG